MFELKDGAEGTVVAGWRFDRMGRYPWISVEYLEAEREFNEDGTQKRNAFGGWINRWTSLGRKWALHLNPAETTNFNRMQILLFNMQFTLVHSALARLGLTVTAEALQAAIQAEMAEGKHIDFFITKQLEEVEKERRAGTFSPSSVTGAAP